DGLAPLGLDAAVDVEAPLREDGGRRRQHQPRLPEAPSGSATATHAPSIGHPLPLDSRSRHSPTREDGYDPGRGSRPHEGGPSRDRREPARGAAPAPGPRDQADSRDGHARAPPPRARRAVRGYAL